MQCYNTGFDGRDVNWKCVAEVNPKVKLDSAVVNCEGYAYPDDPYVLAGSCAVKYSLGMNSGYQTPNHYENLEPIYHSIGNMYHNKVSFFDMIENVMVIGLVIITFIIMVMCL